MNRIKGSLWAKILGWIIWTLSTVSLVGCLLGFIVLEVTDGWYRDTDDIRKELNKSINSGYSYYAYRNYQNGDNSETDQYFEKYGIDYQYMIVSKEQYEQLLSGKNYQVLSSSMKDTRFVKEAIEKNEMMVVKINSSDEIECEDSFWGKEAYAYESYEKGNFYCEGIYYDKQAKILYFKAGNGQYVDEQGNHINEVYFPVTYLTFITRNTDFSILEGTEFFEDADTEPYEETEAYESIETFKEIESYEDTEVYEEIESYEETKGYEEITSYEETEPYEDDYYENGYDKEDSFDTIALCYDFSENTYYLASENDIAIQKPIDNMEVFLNIADTLIFGSYGGDVQGKRISVQEFEQLPTIVRSNMQEESFPEISNSYLDRNYTLHVSYPQQVDYVISNLNIDLGDDAIEYSGLLSTTKSFLINNNPYVKAGLLTLLMERGKSNIIWVSIVSFLFTMASTLFLICGAGYRKNQEGIVLTPIDRLPFDLLTGVALLNGMLYCYGLLEMSDFFSVSIVSLYGMYTLVTMWLLLLTLLSFAVRIKNHKWWKNTMIYWCLSLSIKILKRIIALFGRVHRFIQKVWKEKALTKRFFIIWSIISICEFIGLVERGHDEPLVVIWFIEKIVLTVVLLLYFLQFKHLKEGAQAIANGDTKKEIDVNGIFTDLNEMAEEINHIGQGISVAVDEKMKSERFKTELITNVSHDIKTPLTSIINYVDLLQKEKIENEHATEYLEVLERQSIRLKKLIEDLVEASKASSGALPIVEEKIDLSVFVSQVAGEYQEKMEANHLTLIIDKPKESVEAIADGRHLWRVLDNILNNACKYSQEGSRVYLSLSKEGTIVMKNISKYELNITAEELMERFVRGDSSRHTEGHGLGLSIAKSLMELMGGSLELVIDGDLFKVIMTLDDI